MRNQKQKKTHKKIP